MPSTSREQLAISREQLTSKLLSIKSNEEAKGRSRHIRPPAIFRETALDTHRTMAPEYFGPSIVAERKENPTRLNSATHLATIRQQRAAREGLTRTTQLTVPGEVRSVFAPTPEQMPICSAAVERRANVASSEWALLDTWEVQLFLNEREAQQRALRAAQSQQRTALDSQMSALQQAKLAAEAAKIAEREELQASVRAREAAERQRLDSQRMAAMKLRTEREEVLSEVRAQREATMAEKKREEKRAAAAAAAAMQAEKTEAYLKAMNAREVAARTQAENEILQAERRAAEMAQKQADADTSKRMAAMMLAQERARDGQAEAIQAAVMARAGRAGTKAMDDKRALLEREERLIAEAAREADRREAERRKADLDKRARQKAEIIDVNESLKRDKAEREAAAREETRRLRAIAEAQAAAEKEQLMRDMQLNRDKATLTKRYVASQRDETYIKAKFDDVFMTDRERCLNKQLLEQARNTVENKQLAVYIP